MLSERIDNISYNFYATFQKRDNPELEIKRNTLILLLIVLNQLCSINPEIHRKNSKK